MACWANPVHPCLCLGQKLPDMIILERKSRAECVWLLRPDQTAHSDENQGVPSRAVPPPFPSSCSLCSSTESQVVRGSVVANTQDGSWCPGWRESSLWKGRAAASSILHPATRPHLALAQGAALLTDTASSWAILPSGERGLQGPFVSRCMEWHSSQNPRSGRSGAMAEVSPDPPSTVDGHKHSTTALTLLPAPAAKVISSVQVRVHFPQGKTGRGQDTPILPFEKQEWWGGVACTEGSLGSSVYGFDARHKVQFLLQLSFPCPVV